MPYFIRRTDVAHALGVKPETVSYRIKKGFLPPLDSELKPMGWCADTLAEHQPRLFRLIAAYFAELQAQG
jgi:hypothetical protein